MAEEILSKTVLMLILMVFSINFINYIKMKGFHFISETGLYVLIGFVVGFCFVNLTASSHKDDIYNRDIQLDPKFFYMVLLPPIIFEGGFTLQRVTFVRNLVPILLLALVGASYSTFVTSGLMAFFSYFCFPSLNFDFLDALIFGSIISSTDPVSVLGMLPPGTDRNLYMMIFGESALNDAVAIIFFRVFTELAAEEQAGILFCLIKGAINASKIFKALGSSLVIFVGSLLVGVLTALIFAKLTKHVKSPEAPIYQLTMFLVFAYTSYLLADGLELTGIISVFFCGATMAHYAYDNLSKVTLLSSKVILRTFSSMCDAFIFLYLGMGIFAFGDKQTRFNWPFIICAVISILVSRTHVFLLGGLYNRFVILAKEESKVIPMSHQIFLWFCGLRGAVSFALSVQILNSFYLSEDIRHLIFGTTIATVFFTVLGFGSLTPYMMKVLKLTEPEEKPKGLPPVKEEDEEDEDDKRFRLPPKAVRRKSTDSVTTLDEYMPHETPEHAAEEAAEFMDAMNNGFWMKIYELDKRYLKPFFSNSDKRTNRTGNVVYETTAKQKSKLANENFFEIENNNVVSAMDDMDELDRVPISMAAEMYGLASMANLNVNVKPQMPSPTASININTNRASRSPSISSLNKSTRRSSKLEMQVLKKAALAAANNTPPSPHSMVPPSVASVNPDDVIILPLKPPPTINTKTVRADPEVSDESRPSTPGKEVPQFLTDEDLESIDFDDEKKLIHK